jgi:small conductance mechanosensitive channel
MDRLGLPTAEYKQLLIAATGEITTDVFDAEVAQGLVATWADGVRDSVVSNGPSFLFKTLFFALVIGGFWLLSRFVRKVTERAVEAPHLRFSQLLKRMIASLASGTVMLMGVLIALSQLGVQIGPLLAGLGIAGFIVGFALQETLGNFAAGVMILAYRPYDVGDLIDCAGGVFGKVSHMNLVSTTVLTIDNQTKIVPNGKIWGDVITNVTAQTKRRVDLVFGISYTDDIPHAEEVMWSVIKEHPKVLSDPEPVIKLHELGDSSVNFVVRPWCSRDDYWDVHWDVTREVKLRFDREGISIPFPQRDVHFYPTQTNGGALPGTPAESTPVSDRTALTGQSEPDTDV